ncbi:MAG TPA: phosphatidylinositol mannoside acyltransferase [Mycobacteriales bacterium]|nr:phosphatidylinositol mannoside acyltransferase [Mycobacteriales bacterium]
MNESLLSTLYAAGWAVVRGMPERLARRQFDAIADAIWLRAGSGVMQLEANLARVRPDLAGRELRLLTRAGLRSYLRYWCEVFQLPAMPMPRLVERSDVTGLEHLWAARDAGRGIILALPHSGNWDQAGSWVINAGVPFTTVAERLEPAALFDRFVAFRESIGMEVIPLTGGERPPYQLLAERLRAGGMLCLLADRDLTATGVQVDFFGLPARLPAGPAALARDTGAALLPVTLCYPDRWRWGIRVHGPIRVPDHGDRKEQVRAMTQRLADVFAAAIAEHPQDWHMLQRVWVADLDASRLTGELAV